MYQRTPLMNKDIVMSIIFRKRSAHSVENWQSYSKFSLFSQLLNTLSLVDYLASKILAKIQGTDMWAYLENLGTR